MTKIIEKNVAEIIIISLFLTIFMTSCASSHQSCAAYASVEVENKID